MRFEVHAARAAGPNTLLQLCETFPEAMALFAGLPEVRATYPAGEAPAVDPRAPWAIVPVGTAEELANLGNLQSINPLYSGGCYLLSEGGGVSCLGFEVAERWRAETLEWLRAEGFKGICGPMLYSTDLGTPWAFAAYRATMRAGADYSAATGRRCESELVPQLKGLEGKRVEVVDRHDYRRRFYVGKSTGWRPCHLAITSRRSSGGEPVYGAPFKSVAFVGAR